MNHVIGDLIEVFPFKGKVIDYQAYGSGHINDTYLLRCQDEAYIVQRINDTIFQDVQGLMDNISAVTNHITKKKEERAEDTTRSVLTIVKTKDGQLFYTDQLNQKWRVYIFIDDTYSFDLVEKPEHFYESAYAFGSFQKDLMDFPVETLNITIKDFHHTVKRLENLKQAINLDKMDRVKACQSEIDFILAREAFTHIILDAYARGEIPKRVTHNDTKLNNVLIDKETEKGLCVIDLDTVMPGFVTDDFGDAIRFGTNTALEDEEDLSKVKFDISLYKTYLEGYLKGANYAFNDYEIRLLPYGAKMMTLENAIRFLTDYLEGDHYFKVSKENHNLIRAKNQIKLISEMEKDWDNLTKLSEEYI